MLKRYNAFTNYNMIESVDGQYVRYEDIEELKAENLELRELLGSFMTDLDLMDPDIRNTNLWKHYTKELKRINAKLKENSDGGSS